MVKPARMGNLSFVSLPLVKLSGSSFQQGIRHGEALRDRIRHNLNVYFDRFRLEAKLERTDVLAWASRMADTIRDRSPEYFEGMRGIAQGSGFEFLEVVALNVRYEILYFQFGEVGLAQQGQTRESASRASFGKPDGCTLFAVAPDASLNGHLLMGQAWDWIPQVQGAVLHTFHDDGLETLTFTEAGIFGGKIGLNSAGVGLCISGLTSMDDDWSRAVRPVHVRCYEILRSRTFEDAMRVVTDEERACSTNFLIGQAPNRVFDLEAAPNGVMQLSCVNGTLAHANHFVNPEALGIAETPMDLRTHSYSRFARMTQLLETRQPHSVKGLQDIMRDKHGFPDSICFHPNPNDPPEERYMTVTAVVMDLQTHEIWLSDGPPDENPFEHHRLG
jgi:isopenicillin-N N-acyltransferase-like protein